MREASNWQLRGDLRPLRARVDLARCFLREVELAWDLSGNSTALLQVWLCWQRWRFTSDWAGLRRCSNRMGGVKQQDRDGFAADRSRQSVRDQGGGELGSEEGADWFANAGIALLAGIGAFVHHGK